MRIVLALLLILANNVISAETKSKTQDCGWWANITKGIAEARNDGVPAYSVMTGFRETRDLSKRVTLVLDDIVMGVYSQHRDKSPDDLAISTYAACYEKWGS